MFYSKLCELVSKVLRKKKHFDDFKGLQRVVKVFFYFLFITLLFLIVFYCCCVFLHRWLCVMKNALRVLRTAWRLVRTTFCFENWEKLSKVKSFNLVFIKLISHHLKKNNFKILVAINITWFKAGQFNFQKNLLKLAR